MKQKTTFCPLHQKERPIWWVLADLAAQENCDGEPYDQMQDASDYIRELEKALTMIEETPGGRVLMYRMRDDKRYPFK